MQQDAQIQYYDLLLMAWLSMTSHVMICIHMQQGIMTHQLFSSHLTPAELSYISLSGKFCIGMVKCKINFYLFHI
jgi:hypothetical protein